MDVNSLLTRETPKLRNCVHCGLCLDVCPTYRITGNENNSPRGRLAIWRAIDEGRLVPDDASNFYTSECVGCLACESACPANVPYGDILTETLQARNPDSDHASLATRSAIWLAEGDIFARLAGAFLRLGRKLGALPFPQGAPAVLKSSPAYARQLSDGLPEDAPRVALLAGCIGDSVFREISFSTIRAFVRHGIHVTIPGSQVCCGAIHEHTGQAGVESLISTNREAFLETSCDVVITNSAGCNRTLSKQLNIPVEDAIYYLDRCDLKPVTLNAERVFLDLPCHLYHGRGLKHPPANVMKALGVPWELVPQAEYCCGAGGLYQYEKKKNAEAIMASRHTFLKSISAENVIIATLNQVCMMQWHRTVKTLGLTNRIRVTHLISLIGADHNTSGTIR